MLRVRPDPVLRIMPVCGIDNSLRDHPISIRTKAPRSPLSVPRRYRTIALVLLELGHVDRRETARFPIEREICYKLLRRNGGNEQGTGKSINISSGGVLFTTDCALQPGIGIEVTISWPVRLDSEVPLRLVVRGRVVRSDSGHAAMVISRYEFRTKASHQ
jgi:hypothetical protein